jgi:hypothetical protein
MTMPWEQTLSQWQATWPPWLRALVDLTPAERKQRLDELSWRGPPDGYGLPNLKRHIIRGDWAALKAYHEQEVRARLRLQPNPQTQFVLESSPEKSPDFYRRPELVAEFKAFWAKDDAEKAAQEAREAGERAAFELYGFPEHPKILKTRRPLPEGIYTFEQFVRKGCSSYTRLWWFVRFLEGTGYPFLKDGLIAQIGYELLCKAHKSVRKAEKLESAKNLREANAPVKQVPEPKKKKRKTKKT